MLSNQTYLRNEQYKNASNLNARIELHQRFSTNSYDWPLWAFDQFDLLPQARVLEIGCGPGTIWLANRNRIPAGWSITLTDFSPGMLAEAQRNLADVHPFTFELADAQALPFDHTSFDAVIANHMLYHVPDRAKAYSEICRVLRPSGRLYAATNGTQHFRELDDLERRFDLTSIRQGSIADSSFRLDTSGDELSRWFAQVEVRHYNSDLVVTEVEPLVDYILSEGAWTGIDPSRQPELRDFVTRELAMHGGAIRITKDVGMFVATRS